MKGKVFKRIVSVMLVMVLVLSLCGCGDSGANANNALAKENVYAYEDIDLGIDTNNVNVHVTSYMNEKIYVLFEDYSGTYSTVDPRVSTLPAFPEDNVSSDVAVEEPVEGDVDIAIEEPVYTGPTMVLVSMKLDGTERSEVILQRMDSQNGYYMDFTIDPNGSVYALQEEYMSDFSDPENPIYKTNYTLIGWDTTGNIAWTASLNDHMEEDEYFWPQDFYVNTDGTITFFSYEGKVFNYGSDGLLISKINLDEAALTNMGMILRKGDGSVYMTNYNDDYSKMFISEMDMTTGTIGEKIELPGNINNYGIKSGSTTDLVLSNSLGVYTYNIGDEAPVMIMDFINSDFPSTNMQEIFILDDTHMLASYNDATDWSLHFAYCTKVNPEDVPDKKVIVLGCSYIDYNVRQRVVDFNKSNQEYRITIKDYSTYNTMGDYLAGYTQLNNDIISGKMPDILMIDDNTNSASYIKKGLFADIGKLIEEDEELSQVEFLDNVFEAFSVNGTLYSVVPGFSVRTVVGKTSVLGDRTGWNMSEFLEFQSSLNKNVKVFGYDMLRENMLSQLFSFAGSDYVDIETGKCNFESEEFIAALEYLKTLPAEYPEGYWDDYDYNFYEGMYRENRAILMQMYMSNFSNLLYNIKGEFGEEVTFIGFPTADKNGTVIEAPSRQFAISAKSKNIAGAWEFVRYYLTDEYQRSDEMYQFPVSKVVFEEKAMEAPQKPYWINEKGEKVEYDQTYWLNGESIVLEPFTEEEVKEMCEFVYSVSKVGYNNTEIRNIITEEAESFFGGHKTAAEAAEIIQSRAQLWLDVNS